MPESNRITPEMFFDKVVPEHLKTLETDLKCTYVFRVLGEPGGEWTIDLGRRRVTRGGVDKRDVYLEVQRDDFVAIVGQSFDWPTAVSQNRIKWEGNLDLLASLGQLMITKENN